MCSYITTGQVHESASCMDRLLCWYFFLSWSDYVAMLAGAGREVITVWRSLHAGGSALRLLALHVARRPWTCRLHASCLASTNGRHQDNVFSYLKYAVVHLGLHCTYLPPRISLENPSPSNCYRSSRSCPALIRMNS
jgi:hypothetical protein